jgi:uncharacterized protein (UPF0276 family)
MSLTAGLGFKTEHLDEVLTSRDPGLWFEVHAENYMVDGGSRLAALAAVCDRHPVSLHAVGLSLASAEAPDSDYLDRLATLVARVGPVAVSDHLAWQKADGVHHADFLPFPRTEAALAQVIDNVDRVQSVLRRPILVENPSLYVDLPGHEMSEAEFLTALARRAGCGLLVDVNNLYVSASNLAFNPEAALDALPADAIGEVHLAGHTQDADPESPLLIDTHAAPVAEPVWRLYQRLLVRVGPRPTLIERDDAIPPFATLMAERSRAHDLLASPEFVHA